MFEQTFKNIDDILWKEAGCQSELDYIEQTSWIIFLKYLTTLPRKSWTRSIRSILHASSLRAHGRI